MSVKLFMIAEKKQNGAHGVTRPALEKNPVGRPPIGEAAAVGHIHLRVTMARKNAYVLAARVKGLSLSLWMVANLDEAANHGNRD